FLVTPFNTGGRYDPSTDNWTTTSLTHAPAGRYNHTAVWTGSEMIVWGGFTGLNAVKTGGRYNPGTDAWPGTTTARAPSVRSAHAAVWTSSQMIVWGGILYTNSSTSTGGRYCAPSPPAQLGNISTRAFVQTNDNVMIGGFIVQGTGPKRVIIRA